MVFVGPPQNAVATTKQEASALGYTAFLRYVNSAAVALPTSSSDTCSKGEWLIPPRHLTNTIPICTQGQESLRSRCSRCQKVALDTSQQSWIYNCTRGPVHNKPSAQLAAGAIVCSLNLRIQGNDTYLSQLSHT